MNIAHVQHYFLSVFWGVKTQQWYKISVTSVIREKEKKYYCFKSAPNNTFQKVLSDWETPPREGFPPKEEGFAPELIEKGFFFFGAQGHQWLLMTSSSALSSPAQTLVLYCKIPPAKTVYIFMCTQRLTGYLWALLCIQDFHQIQTLEGGCACGNPCLFCRPPLPHCCMGLSWQTIV